MDDGEAGSRPVANLLGLAVLTYLTQRPMHAYEIHRQMKANDAASTFKLSYGALYSVVGQLQKAGFVTAAGTGRKGNLPKHTELELTPAGRYEIGDWMRELLSQPRHEYPAFAAALSLIVVLPPGEVRELLRLRLERLDADRASIVEVRDRTIADGVHPLFLVEDDYRVALVDAEAAFIRELLTTMDDPAAGWTGPWEAHHSGAAGNGAKT
jgi:DNA-binding PadR family transcriptional regulator